MGIIGLILGIYNADHTWLQQITINNPFPKEMSKEDENFIFFDIFFWLIYPVSFRKVV